MHSNDSFSNFLVVSVHSFLPRFLVFFIVHTRTRCYNFSVPQQFDIAFQIFNIGRPAKRWSRIVDYSEYMHYQNKLRNAILATGTIPLEWEFEHWLAAAKSSGRSGL